MIGSFEHRMSGLVLGVNQRRISQQRREILCLPDLAAMNNEDLALSRPVCWSGREGGLTATYPLLKQIQFRQGHLDSPRYEGSASSARPNYWPGVDARFGPTEMGTRECCAHRRRRGIFSQRPSFYRRWGGGLTPWVVMDRGNSRRSSRSVTRSRQVRLTQRKC